MRARLRLGDLAQRHGGVRGRPQLQVQLQRHKLPVFDDHGRVEAEELVFISLCKCDVGVRVPQDGPGELLRQVENLAVRSAETVFPVSIGQSLDGYGCGRMNRLLLALPVVGIKAIHPEELAVSLPEGASRVCDISPW